MNDGLPLAPAAERNKGPILDVLRDLLPRAGGTFETTVLEIASGLGQHSAHFAENLPHLCFQPSEADSDSFNVLEQRVARLALPNLLPPLRLDVTQTPWPVKRANAIFNANMIHISPWEVTPALFAGAALLLEPSAPFITYGPYRIDGKHTAPSNEQFEQWLKAQDPRFGVRDLTELEHLADACGFTLEQRIPMPANNFCLLWRRT